MQAVLLLPVTLRVVLIPAIQIEVASIGNMRARLDSLSLHPADGGGIVRESREMLQGIGSAPSKNPSNYSKN